MGKTSRSAKGTRDILPKVAELRAATLRTICDKFHSYGFQRVETPCIENIQNLRSGDGGENEGLVFEILKRGQKLDLSNATNSSDLSDLGLRYDLTLPLSRMVADNREQLPRVFRSLQVGLVWRAERPQKGRFREFLQCDVDIIGEPGIIAEIDLISATTEALVALGFHNFTVRLNDRRVLRSVFLKAGFDEAQIASALISLDKFDKIGEPGVIKEMEKKGFGAYETSKAMALIKDLQSVDLDTASDRCLSKLIDRQTSADLFHTFNSVATFGKKKGFEVLFDPTLVRGLGYYTGQIFEISYKDYSFSLAGGGRYDGMVSSFGASGAPGCGFSIGFERIITILMEENRDIASVERKAVVLYKDMEGVIEFARQMRQQYPIVTIAPVQKSIKKQLDEYKEDGFSLFCIFSPDEKDPKMKSLD